MMATTLRWDGPFTFFDHEDRRWCFAPGDDRMPYEDAQGLYLHTLRKDNTLFIYYVGISGKSDLVTRQRQHATEYLAGGYWFYDAASSLQHRKLAEVYGERNRTIAWDYWTPDNGYRKFMKRGSGLRERAEEWLDALRVFYCVPDGNRATPVLKLYESALIRPLLNDKKKTDASFGMFCDNMKVSVGPPAEPIVIQNTFDPGVTVAGLEAEIRYPSL